MEFLSEKVIKGLEITDGKIVGSYIINRLTGKRLELRGYEFGVSYIKGGFPRKKSFFNSNDATVSECLPNGVSFRYFENGIEFSVKVLYSADEKTGTLKKTLTLRCSDEKIRLEYIDLDSFDVAECSFKWTVPLAEKRVYIPAYVTTMGQPYYVEDMFFGGEFPTADNRISGNTAYCRYFLERTFGEIAENGEYLSVPFVMGSGKRADFYSTRADFLEYISAVAARPARFRVQYNSWYDNMLDINGDNIEKSFRAIAKGFENAGYRHLDCYVVDDGWIDYSVPKFWEFDKEKFPDEFYRESDLSKELGSTFGVWFGPRGGYTTVTPKFAARLASIGYPKCRQSNDICTGNPRYIADLCAKMADFCQKYNVTYFKIDGFAATPCRSRKHGHPKGRGDGLGFYTFLWEEWTKGFAKIREVCPDVYLNITSYAHCSPWFLKWADAVWLNNCADMGYAGKGDNLSQCLNYRDGKYRDFYEVRELQFPNASLYNHEPCYAFRNCNPPFNTDDHTPSEKHPTVVYTTEEFRTYLYACMMRGTGFVELYFSPDMMNAEMFAAATEVLRWAEDNFEILKRSKFFGGEPEKGEVYGYYANLDGKGILMLRNSSDVEKTYSFAREKLDFSEGSYTVTPFFPERGEAVSVESGKTFDVTLKPYEIGFYYIDVVQ